jgi:dihydroxyacetone kinase-like protein
MIILNIVGGASGPIWGSAFRSAAKYAVGKTELNLAEFSELMQSAVDGLQKKGGAELGNNTLLDALIPTVKSLKRSSKNDENLMDSMKKSVQAAVDGADSTLKTIATKGRASYVGERSINYSDTGAKTIDIIFTGVVQELYS